MNQLQPAQLGAVLRAGVPVEQESTSELFARLLHLVRTHLGVYVACNVSPEVVLSGELPPAASPQRLRIDPTSPAKSALCRPSQRTGRVGSQWPAACLSQLGGERAVEELP